MNLLTEKESKLFIKYLFPTMLSMAIISFYIITDTVMIGQGVGQSGLVALNLLLPLFSVYFGIGSLFGVGGSVLMSVAKGNQDEKRANAIFVTALISLTLIAVSFTVLQCCLKRPICYLMGADVHNIDLVMEYAKYLIPFCSLFMYAPFFQGFIRNDGDPKRAMAASITGSLLNVLLDYIFIFWLHWGLAGAMIATVIGMMCNIGITCTHFLSHKNTIKFDFHFFNLSYVKEILKNGVTAFLNEMASGIVIYFFNMQILKYIGETGIVVYSVIANTAIVITIFQLGVANSMQPLVSYNYGGGKMDRVRCFRKHGLSVIMMISVIFYGIVFFFTKELIYAYVKHPELIIMEMGLPAIKIYFLCVFGSLFNILFGVYFQAIVKPQIAFLISVLRGLILCVMLVLILPQFFGGGIIWWVMCMTEGATLLVTLYFLSKKI